MRMIPPKFYGSKVDEDPMEFIEKVHRIVAIIRVPSHKQIYLVAYQLNNVVLLWYEQ